MKLSECKMGEIVRRVEKCREDHIVNVGHIVGLSANGSGEIIPLVLFACAQKPQGIHHNNIEIYKD